MSHLKMRMSDGQPLIDLADIADINEILSVDYENRRRAEEYMERKHKARAPRKSGK